MPTTAECCAECLRKVDGNKLLLPCNGPYADGECWKPSTAPLAIEQLRASLKDKPGLPDD